MFPGHAGGAPQGGASGRPFLMAILILLLFFSAQSVRMRLLATQLAPPAADLLPKQKQKQNKKMISLFFCHELVLL